MDFIPLENASETSKKKQKQVTVTGKSKKKLKLNEKLKKTSSVRVLEKKNVKNKYKETLALKQKNKTFKKKKSKEIEEQREINVNTEEEDEKNDIENEEEEETEEDEDKIDEDDEVNSEEEAFKRKCREMDEKKKNRLFIKLKKKITNEAMIKELHPNIRGVIFPRKKRPRWCWAVFASEEKANASFNELRKNKEILVSKPNPYERVHQKHKEKMKTVLKKKEIKKKLQNIWL